MTTTATPRNDQLPPPPVAQQSPMLGMAIGAASGSSKTAPRAATVTAPGQTVVQTVPGPTRTVVHVRKVPGPTTTMTQTVQSSMPAPAAAASPPASNGGGGQVYSGNGSKNFGTIVVNSDSTLHWTCQCDPANGFYLSSDLDQTSFNSIDIQQSGSSGTTTVSAGTYPNVQSIGNGQFSFYLSPG